MSENQIINKEDLVVRFAGDSGDGMQLSGTLFSDASALTGNDIATFPDYPAEIRAPHNTIAGVSGYQVQYGLKKSFAGAKTKTAKKTATQLKLGKLKAGKTYYVRIRAYKTVKGKKYYSAWSKAVKKKTR